MRFAAAIMIATMAAWPAQALAQRVLAVRPSGPFLAANTLRLSIVFSSTPADSVTRELTLRRADQSIIATPFDPQELWSPDGRILTLLFQPGRVKTGLIAHEKFGRALVQGQRVVLDYSGKVIASWIVGPSDTSPPRPDR